MIMMLLPYHLYKYNTNPNTGIGYRTHRVFRNIKFIHDTSGIFGTARSPRFGLYMNSTSRNGSRHRFQSVINR